jgi:hypothetical protein
LIPEASPIARSLYDGITILNTAYSKSFRSLKLYAKRNGRDPGWGAEYKLSHDLAEVGPSGISGMPRSDGCGEELGNQGCRTFPLNSWVYFLD